MSDLYDLLNKIKKNPSVYLGSNSILSFPPFWYGYTIAEDQFRIQVDDRVIIQARRQERKFFNFLQWIREKYEVQTSQSWAKIILFYSPDERIAIDRFFELWSEYLNLEQLPETDKVSDSSSGGRHIKFDFYELLDKIKARPAMYLSTNSIFSFFAFWSGYKIAREQFGIQPTKQHEKFEEFLRWIPQRYEVQTDQSWTSIIFFYSSDERRALDTFFELWSEFLNPDELSEIDNDSDQ